MTREQGIAFIQAQTVCAMAEIEAMKAENERCKCELTHPSYSESDFTAVPRKYGLEHNDIIMYFQRWD